MPKKAIQTGVTVAVLLFLIPAMARAKERGTVVAIWEQRNFYEHFYSYRVETDTHFYVFLGDSVQAFQLGDLFVFTIDKDHRRVVANSGGKKTKLLLLLEGLKSDISRRQDSAPLRVGGRELDRNRVVWLPKNHATSRLPAVDGER
jgi:hypothetical protein